MFRLGGFRRVPSRVRAVEPESCIRITSSLSLNLSSPPPQITIEDVVDSVVENKDRIRGSVPKVIRTSSMSSYLLEKVMVVEAETYLPLLIDATNSGPSGQTSSLSHGHADGAQTSPQTRSERRDSRQSGTVTIDQDLQLDISETPPDTRYDPYPTAMAVVRSRAGGIRTLTVRQSGQPIHRLARGRRFGVTRSLYSLAPIKVSSGKNVLIAEAYGSWNVRQMTSRAALHFVHTSLPQSPHHRLLLGSAPPPLPIMPSKPAAMLAAIALSFASWVAAQCPNEVAIYHPTLRTMTTNSTWFIVPVPATAAQKALDDFYGIGNGVISPSPHHGHDTLPVGIPEHRPPRPRLIRLRRRHPPIRPADRRGLAGRQRLRALRPARRARDDAILSAPLNNYLTGANGDAIAALVPSTVSTLIEGVLVRLGRNVPADAAYQLNSAGVLSNQVAWDLLPNPLSGPGVTPEVLDFQYQAADAFTTVTAELFKAVLNQPVILYGALFVAGQCQRMQYYFTNATGAMLPRSGNVTLGPAADGLLVQTTGTLQQASPDGSGFYGALQGFSACAQNVDYTVESCDSAATNVDPAAL